MAGKGKGRKEGRGAVDGHVPTLFRSGKNNNLVSASGAESPPRLRECCRQCQAEVVNKSNNKIHQTWCTIFSQSLSVHVHVVVVTATIDVVPWAMLHY